MLSIPVYENPDEAIAYFGWTENISLFTKRRAESSWTLKPQKVAAVNKLQHHELIGDSDHILGKYAAPLSMQCKFNALRSGQFGSTDPFIRSLFSAADFTQDANDHDVWSEKDLEDYLQRVDEEELKSARDDLDHYFCDSHQSRPVYDVDIPGELILALDIDAMPTGNAKAVARAAHAPMQTTIVPFSKVHKSIPESPAGDLLDGYPRYDFPGKSGNSRRSSIPGKQVVFTTAYTSSRLDYMHI